MLMAPPQSAATQQYNNRGVTQHFEAKAPVFASYETTLFLIDWDDTVLASSWLAAQGLRLDSVHVPEEVASVLQQLEAQASILLTRAIELGSVALVTNAESGWIELSCRKFLPGLYSLLSRVRILSARTTFEAQFPGQTQVWKNMAYEQVCSAVFSNLAESGYTGKYNVLSLGDSLYERNALIHLAKKVPAAVTKSVKLIERPTCGQVQRQLEIINGNLDTLVQSSDPVDLMLTIDYLDC